MKTEYIIAGGGVIAFSLIGVIFYYYNNNDSQGSGINNNYNNNNNNYPVESETQPLLNGGKKHCKTKKNITKKTKRTRKLKKR